MSDFRVESNIWIIGSQGWFGFAFSRIREWIRDMSNVSILIVARNAASTIDRAMHSVFRQGNYPIVLMGDDSSDDTVARPKAMGMERLQVVTVAVHSQLGAARQLGLESIDTEFFDDTCIAADDPARPISDTYQKPSPRFELEMIKKYELEKTACYKIGDSLSDVVAGLNAGIRSVGPPHAGGGDGPFHGTDVEAFGSVVAWAFE